MSETWIICRHVMDGSAEKVELRRDKICLCSECADNIDIVNTEEVFILDEDRLAYTLNNFKQVNGLKHIGKSMDPHGRIITNKRSGQDRRSGNDRRSTSDKAYKGDEKRNTQHRRRGNERRVNPEDLV